MLKNALDFERPIADLDQQILDLQGHMENPGLREWCEEHNQDYTAEIAKLKKGLTELQRARKRLVDEVFSNLSPWEKTQVARHKDRPHTLDYVREFCDDFLELHGDRTYADDPAIVGGIAQIGDHRVMVVGHEKGRDLKEKVRRNYGSAKPEGYHKAVRLCKLAERFGRPVVTFVDTSAADSSIGSEERGISAAIAWAMEEMAMLRTPIIVVVVGEGGSGGAIGIGVGDRILMLEHSVYSVIPPEGCANILWRDSSRAAEAADALKITAQDALRLGCVDEVVPEAFGGAHRNVQETARSVQEAITRHLDDLVTVPIDTLLEQRYNKFRRMGRWDVEPE